MNDLQANDLFAALPPVALPAPNSAFRLASHILIDFEAYEYDVQGERVSMSQRESQLLSALVKKYFTSPRGYVSLHFLVEWMIPQWTDYLDPEQSIAQIVSGIRKKWGETPYKPRFLISRRDKGYQLRPEPGYGYVVS
jgi:DNA-binding response OmpR family regulator